MDHTHPMGIALVILVFALSIWVVLSLAQRLRQASAGAGLWLMFSVLAACGIGAGIWCAFYCEYPVGTHLRIGSFPLPVVFFHFEDGQWVDFPVPKLQAWLTMATNIIAIATLATLPVRLVFWRRQKLEPKL